VIIFQILLGLVFGSFLNVLVWRLNDPEAPKFWQGRSLCPHCRKRLSWIDNIPLLSFIALRGKCRHCQNKISWQYPAVELLTALVTISIFFLFPGVSLMASLFYCFIAYIFIVIYFSDLIYGLIPDEMILVGLVLGFINLLGNTNSLVNGVFSGMIASVLFLAVFLLTKQRGMGFGDVKLAFLMGLILGWPKILVAFWFAFVVGGGVALVLLLLRKTKLSATIALGPFLIFGLVVSALWSDVFLRFVGVTP
jgi:leader peptidase (prepilin peptidase)/N-methyltransferase